MRGWLITACLLMAICVSIGSLGLVGMNAPADVPLNEPGTSFQWSLFTPNPLQAHFYGTTMICEPAFTSNGEVEERRTDLTIKSRGMDLVFSRTYRTQLNYNGPIGHKWDHSFNIRALGVYDDTQDSQMSMIGLSMATALKSSFSEQILCPGRFHRTICRPSLKVLPQA